MHKQRQQGKPQEVVTYNSPKAVAEREQLHKEINANKLTSDRKVFEKTNEEYNTLKVAKLNWRENERKQDRNPKDWPYKVV